MFNMSTESNDRDVLAFNNPDDSNDTGGAVGVSNGSKSATGTSSPSKGSSRSKAVLSGIRRVLGLLLALFGIALMAGIYNPSPVNEDGSENPVGKAVISAADGVNSVVPYKLQPGNWSSTEEGTTEDGATLYTKDSSKSVEASKVEVNDQGIAETTKQEVSTSMQEYTQGSATSGDYVQKAFAPLPKNPVNDYTCPNPDKSARNETTPSKSSWSIPSVGQYNIPVEKEPGFIIKRAPTTTQDTRGADIGATNTGLSTLQFGHVNYNLGSSGGLGPADLSPIGMLHATNPCDHIYQTSDSGKTMEYYIVTIAVLPQEVAAGKFQSYINDDSGALYMVTCAGKFKGDAGGEGMFGNYDHNIIVKALPVTSK